MVYSPYIWLLIGPWPLEMVWRGSSAILEYLKTPVRNKFAGRLGLTTPRTYGDDIMLRCFYRNVHISQDIVLT